jgi:16S rRNA (cytosine1402-N4)-methyltransferase
VGIDRDPRAIEAVSKRLERFAGRFNPIEGNYADAETLLGARGLLPVDGILLDLGLSSVQLDDPVRGFSFQVDGPLDMRMEQQGTTAAELIRASDEKSLSQILWELGEERFSRPIARALKRLSPETTFQAVEAVKQAVPRRAWPKRIHVATRTFQALRIAVNQELEALETFLAALPKLLKVGGVAAVISFHSLEDRRVKHRFRDLEEAASFKRLTRKAIQASQTERDENPRARSARLRAVERVQ